MADVLVAILAIAIGAAFCFRGYLAMRIVIPIWGFFAGFAFGAGLFAGLVGRFVIDGAGAALALGVWGPAPPARAAARGGGAG